MGYSDPEKQAKYQRDWIRNRRREWVRENGPCELCGSSERLQVDHRDPAAKTSHRIWSWSKPKRDAELAKCRVLCFCCHYERHHPKSPCGTVARYKRGCRCGPCTVAKAAYQRSYRKIRRAIDPNYRRTKPLTAAAVHK